MLRPLRVPCPLRVLHPLRIQRPLPCKDAWGASRLVSAFTSFDGGGSGLTLTATDCNAPGTTGLAHRDGHGKDTVLVPGLGLVSIYGPGEGYGTLKGAAKHFTH